MHEVLVNRLGGLSLPRKSVVRLTDRPDMTVDVYRGRKTTIQSKYRELHDFFFFFFFLLIFLFIYFFYVFCLSLLLQCKFANSTLLSILSFSYFMTPCDAQASSAFSALICKGQGFQQFHYYCSACHQFAISPPRCLTDVTHK